MKQPNPQHRDTQMASSSEGAISLPTNNELLKLHWIQSELEVIAASVEAGRIMPTPDNIRDLANVANRLRWKAEAAGFEIADEVATL